jgi:chemotaxis protein CheZ
MASLNSAASADRPVLQAEVEEIIRSVMSNEKGEPPVPPPVKLYDELGALARYIQQARSEIAAVRPAEIGSKHIPSATDELDAVVGATERATGQIMDACETIETISGKLAGEVSTALVDAVTSIYEACSFQDITGQRITKVVKTLKHIEEQVSKLLDAFGEELAKTQQPADSEGPAVLSDADLLNGPQLPGRGVDQAEIDRLLASFD